MTATEINAFARRANNDREFAGKQVVIRNGAGRYLDVNPTGKAYRWTDRAHAHVFDYDRDQVGLQLEKVETSFAALGNEAEWAAEAA
jgi:hypothetical protein